MVDEIQVVSFDETLSVLEDDYVRMLERDSDAVKALAAWLGLEHAHLEKYSEDQEREPAGSPGGGRFAGGGVGKEPNWIKDQGNKKPIERVSIDRLSTNPNEKWTDRYRNSPETVVRLNRMADRMKEGKTFSALTVQRGDGERLIIIDGQHRFEAARIAGLSHIGVQISDKAFVKYSDDQKREPAGSSEGGQFAGGDGTSSDDKTEIRTKTLSEKESIQLQSRVLAHGGSETENINPKDYDNKQLLSRGFYQSGKDAEKIKGEPNSCHGNAARAWQAGKGTLVTGYARGIKGGTKEEAEGWISHSWIVGKGETILETTGHLRLGYYGYKQMAVEAREFYQINRDNVQSKGYKTYSLK